MPPSSRCSVFVVLLVSHCCIWWKSISEICNCAALNCFGVYCSTFYCRRRPSSAVAAWISHFSFLVSVFFSFYTLCALRPWLAAFHWWIPGNFVAPVVWNNRCYGAGDGGAAGRHVTSAVVIAIIVCCCCLDGPPLHRRSAGNNCGKRIVNCCPAHRSRIVERTGFIDCASWLLQSATRIHLFSFYKFFPTYVRYSSRSEG